MTRDWTGNRFSTFACMGARNLAKGEREALDFYATHPSAVDALLGAVELPEGRVWEPCCGAGHLSRRLEELGREVYSSDVSDRGYGEVADFFSFAQMPAGCLSIVTNPPFRWATDVVLHALELLPDGGLCCMFMKTQALEGRERWEKLYRGRAPREVLQFVGRMVCAKGGDFAAVEKVGSAVAYAWYVWEKGNYGTTQLRWLP